MVCKNSKSRNRLAARSLPGVVWLIIATSVVSTCTKRTAPNVPDPYPDLHVVSLSPAGESANVATGAIDLVVTFSAEMSLAGLGAVMTPYPAEFHARMRLGNDPRQIITTVKLENNTAYTLLIYSALDRFGDFMRAPYIARFTTGASFPSGMVTGSSNEPFNQPLQSFAGLLQTNVEKLFETSTPDSGFYRNLAGVSGIVGRQGEYMIDSVPDGTFWPFAVLDVDRDGRISLERGDRLQAFDADGDLAPDSIVVSGPPQFGITLGLPITGLSVQSTVPVDGARNVSLNTEFKIGFSAPITTEGLGLFVAPIPAGLSTSDLTLSADGKELSANVTLDQNTAYTAVLYTAKGSRGQILGEPIQVSFTTGPEFPTGKVSGRVHFRRGDGTPQGALVGLLNESLAAVLSKIITGKPPTEVLANSLAAITLVTDEQGTYEIRHVADGTYWPAGTKDEDLDGVIEPTNGVVPGEPIGFYDADGDSSLFDPDDSITIQGGQSLENIVIIFQRTFTGELVPVARP